mmetsp:Transcript_19267/g.59862  ORF Transcript_19267/g.59862 Transcript_19267/m.59862 type:complete len:297 (+) Transcript_19267:2612-3502(+)
MLALRVREAKGAFGTALRSEGERPRRARPPVRHGADPTHPRRFSHEPHRHCSRTDGRECDADGTDVRSALGQRQESGLLQEPGDPRRAVVARHSRRGARRDRCSASRGRGGAARPLPHRLRPRQRPNRAQDQRRLRPLRLRSSQPDPHAVQPAGAAPVVRPHHPDPHSAEHDQHGSRQPAGRPGKRQGGHALLDRRLLHRMLHRRDAAQVDCLRVHRARGRVPPRLVERARLLHRLRLAARLRARGPQYRLLEGVPHPARAAPAARDQPQPRTEDGRAHASGERQGHRQCRPHLLH